MARQKTAKLEIEPEKKTWAESYTSLLLGLVVVVVVGFIVFSFIRGGEKTQETSSVKNDETTQEENNEQKTSASPKTYTVVAGDNLWSIAEKQYKSGYNWVDIAKANKLENPNVLHVGNKLTIPDVKPKIITMAKQKEVVSKVPATNAIKGSSYTVVSGDYLWDIALRAYSDGYKWVEIAKANKLENPNLIFAGNKLKIPR